MADGIAATAILLNMLCIFKVADLTRLGGKKSILKLLHMTAVKRHLEGTSLPRVVFEEGLLGDVDVNFQSGSGRDNPSLRQNKIIKLGNT